MGKLQLALLAGGLLATLLVAAVLVLRPRVWRTVLSVLGVRALPLSPEELRETRVRILATLGAAFAGGAMGGQFVGLGEAVWMYRHWLAGGPELFVFTWNTIAYGIAFAPLGLGIGFGLVFVYLALDRWRAASGSFALSLALTVAACFVIVGRHRFARDVLGDHALSGTHILVLLLFAMALAVVLERVASLAVARLRLCPRRAPMAVLRAFLILALGAHVLGKVLETPEQRPAFTPKADFKAPNLILIVADTLRADHLQSYFAGSASKTPNLLKLAEEGTVFRNSFAQSSWTKPSFGTMFTGMYPSEHTATQKASVLPPQLHTVASLLAERGYYTQGFPNNRNLMPEYGLDKGFIGYTFLEPHIYFGATYSAESTALYQVLRRVRARLMAPKVDIEHFYQPADKVTAVAAQWLDQRPVAPGYPYFLYLHYMDPHDPYMTHAAPGEGYASVLLGTNPSPSMKGKLADAYAREVEYLDHWLGELFAELKQRGEWDNTMIVLTADHGEEFCEHGGWSHGATVYDEVIHVPIVVKWPGNQLAGTVNEHIARHIDVAATMIAVGGAPIPEQVRGIPLVTPDWQFNNASVDTAFAQTDFLQNVGHALRSTSGKYIEMNPDNPSGLPVKAYYDITIDPGEQTNLVEKGGEEEFRLREGLKQLREGMSSP